MYCARNHQYTTWIVGRAFRNEISIRNAVDCLKTNRKNFPFVCISYFIVKARFMLLSHIRIVSTPNDYCRFDPSNVIGYHRRIQLWFAGSRILARSSTYIQLTIILRNCSDFSLLWQSRETSRNMFEGLYFCMPFSTIMKGECWNH